MLQVSEIIYFFVQESLVSASLEIFNKLYWTNFSVYEISMSALLLLLLFLFSSLPWLITLFKFDV